MWEKMFAVLMTIAVNAPALIENAQTAFSGKPGSGVAKKKFVMDNVAIVLGGYQQLSAQPLPPEKAQLMMDTAGLLVESGVAAIKAGQKKSTQSEVAAPSSPSS